MYRQRFFLHHDPLHLHDHHGRRHDHHHDRRRGHHRGRRHDHHHDHRRGHHHDRRRHGRHALPHGKVCHRDFRYQYKQDQKNPSLQF